MSYETDRLSNQQRRNRREQDTIKANRADNNRLIALAAIALIGAVPAGAVVIDHMHAQHITAREQLQPNIDAYKTRLAEPDTITVAEFQPGVSISMPDGSQPFQDKR